MFVSTEFDNKSVDEFEIEINGRALSAFSQCWATNLCVCAATVASHPSQTQFIIASNHINVRIGSNDNNDGHKRLTTRRRICVDMTVQSMPADRLCQTNNGLEYEFLGSRVCG